MMAMVSGSILRIPTSQPPQPSFSAPAIAVRAAKASQTSASNSSISPFQGKDKTSPSPSPSPSLSSPSPSVSSTSRLLVEEKPKGAVRRVKRRRKEKPEDDEDENDKVSEEVAFRLLRRIAVCSGIPALSGLLLCPILFAYLQHGPPGLAVPFWLPDTSTAILFCFAGLGIPFGAASASWDPDREGSLLGLQELQANWPLIWKEDNTE